MEKNGGKTKGKEKNGKKNGTWKNGSQMGKKWGENQDKIRGNGGKKEGKIGKCGRNRQNPEENRGGENLVGNCGKMGKNVGKWVMNGEKGEKWWKWSKTRKNGRNGERRKL